MFKCWLYIVDCGTRIFIQLLRWRPFELYCPYLFSETINRNKLHFARIKNKNNWNELRRYGQKSIYHSQFAMCKKENPTLHKRLSVRPNVTNWPIISFMFTLNSFFLLRNRTRFIRKSLGGIFGLYAMQWTHVACIA